MKALICILHNSATDTYHPIYYIEKLYPGGPETDINKRVTRYRSKAHHTTGFVTLQEAQAYLPELVNKLKEQHYVVISEPKTILHWDGKGMPTDHQVRLNKVKPVEL